MFRRLYFLFPGVDGANHEAQKLVAAGVDQGHIHALARDGLRLDMMPPPTMLQQMDAGKFFESIAWNANLALFAIALLALTLFELWDFSASWSVAAVAVILTTLAMGFLFSNRIPNVHFDEFRDALAHGEVLLMVDVPRRRVAEIVGHVRHCHPEAILGGVCWTLKSGTI